MKLPSSLQRRWQTLAALIDARNLRERALLFFATLAVVFVICQFAIFNPLHAYQAALRQKLSDDQTTLASLRKQTEEKLAKVQQDPDMPNRKRLQELTRQLDAVDAPLAEMMKSLVSPKEMTALVKAVLSSHRRLKVVSLVNLPPEAMAMPAAAGEAVPANNTVPLYKHGLRIEFKGGFRDIVRFFSDLEKLSWKVLWDKVDIKTDRYPESTAAVTVYTLSTNEAWIGL